MKILKLSDEPTCAVASSSRLSLGKKLALTLCCLTGLSPAIATAQDATLSCSDRDAKVNELGLASVELRRTADQMEAERDAFFSDANIAAFIGQVRAAKGAADAACGVSQLAGDANLHVAVACKGWGFGTAIGEAFTEISSGQYGPTVATISCNQALSKGACTLVSAYRKFSEGDTNGAIFKTVEGTGELFKEGVGTDIGESLGGRVAGAAGGMGAIVGARSDVEGGHEQTASVAQESVSLNANTINPMIDNIRGRIGELNKLALDIRRKPCGDSDSLDQLPELRDRIKKLAEEKASQARSQLTDPSEGSGIGARTALAADQFSGTAGSVMTNQIVGSTLSAVTSVAEAKRRREFENARRNAASQQSSGYGQNQDRALTPPPAKVCLETRMVHNELAGPGQPAMVPECIRWSG